MVAFPGTEILGILCGVTGLPAAVISLAAAVA